MRQDILLISAQDVKDNSFIDNNIHDKYILASIREAQDIKYRGIIGSALLNKLKRLVDTATIDAPRNARYKELLEESANFLTYSAIVELLPKVAFKIGNMGVVRTNDENVQNVTSEEVDKECTRYQAKADAYAYMLQNWLLEHRSDLPELGENTCRAIKSNLYSAASCGIFLGGTRGR